MRSSAAASGADVIDSRLFAKYRSDQLVWRRQSYRDVRLVRCARATRADRLVGRAAVGSCDSRGAARDAGAGAFAPASRHFAHALLAHCAMGFERFLRDSEYAFLDVVGVSDQVALEVSRAAGDVGDAMPDQSAGA